MSNDLMIEAPLVCAALTLVWKLGRLAIAKLFEIAKLAIMKWSEGDAERTRVFAKGLSDMAKEIKDLRVDHGDRLTSIENALEVRGAITKAIEEATTGVHAVPEPIEDDAPSPPIPIKKRVTPVAIPIASPGASVRGGL